MHAGGHECLAGTGEQRVNNTHMHAGGQECLAGTGEQRVNNTHMRQRYPGEVLLIRIHYLLGGGQA